MLVSSCCLINIKIDLYFMSQLNCLDGHAQNEQEHEQMNELMLRIDVLVKEKLDLTEKLQSLEEE